MTFKGTPGKWKVRYFPDGSDFFVEAANNNMPQLGYGIEILQDDFGDHNGYPKEQRDADAHLIAAAPELLEALQEAMRRLNSMALSIMAHPDYTGEDNAEWTDMVEGANEAIKTGEAAIDKALNYQS